MKDAVILFVITLVSGSLLGGVYQLTKKLIELATVAANNKAYKAVFAEAETFDPDEVLIVAIPARNKALAGMNFGGVEVENVLKAVDAGGNQLGYVIISSPDSNCGGVVKLSVGLKDDGTITDIGLLEISDTLDLELKVKESAFKDQCAGRNAPEPSVTKSDGVDGTQANTISGVTTTSSATTNAVDVVLYHLYDYIQYYPLYISPSPRDS